MHKFRQYFSLVEIELVYRKLKRFFDAPYVAIATICQRETCIVSTRFILDVLSYESSSNPVFLFLYIQLEFRYADLATELLRLCGPQFLKE